MNELVDLLVRVAGMICGFMIGWHLWDGVSRLLTSKRKRK